MNISKKYLLIFLAVLVFCGNTYSQSKTSDKKIRAELIGVWQDSSSVGSGMTDNFQFFANGFYKFNYNEMNGIKRIFSHSGNWKVLEGKLVLKMKKIELLIGGKWKKASGSSATEYEIEGGKTIEKKVMPTEKLTLNLSRFVKEEYHQTTNIDEIKYWKMSSDPTTYEN